jgi:hypothetical protein
MVIQEKFIRRLTERELGQCNRLLCAAMIDRKIRECLIQQEDLSLFKAYDLPDDLCQWLHTLPRKSIAEFAEAILNWQGRPHSQYFLHSDVLVQRIGTEEG